MFADAVERARNELATQLYQQGIDKVRVQRWQEGCNAFEESMRFKEDAANGPSVRLGLAESYRHLNRQKDAVLILTALAENPVDKEVHDDALSLLAWCQMDLQAWNDAKNTWRALFGASRSRGSPAKRSSSSDSCSSCTERRCAGSGDEAAVRGRHLGEARFHRAALLVVRLWGADSGMVLAHQAAIGPLHLVALGAEGEPERAEGVRTRRIPRGRVRRARGGGAERNAPLEAGASRLASRAAPATGEEMALRERRVVERPARARDGRAEADLGVAQLLEHGEPETSRLRRARSTTSGERWNSRTRTSPCRRRAASARRSERRSTSSSTSPSRRRISAREADAAIELDGGDEAGREVDAAHAPRGLRELEGAARVAPMERAEEVPPRTRRAEPPGQRILGV